MLPDPKIKCPATGFAKSCREILAMCDCPKFVSLKGRGPSGEIVDQHGCVDGFLPLLLVENTQMSRQTGAAVESFRNEVLKANEETAQRQRAAIGGIARMSGKHLE